MPRGKRADKNKKKVEAVQDLQHDHEQFLLAFEKPTQIYRFLRARQILAPTFMHRNLLYMKERCSRTNARRKKFSVKDLLTMAQASESALEHCNERKNENLHVAVTGVSLDLSKKDSRFVKDGKKMARVDVEVLLVRTLLNRRKDMDLAAKEMQYGIVDVPVNPKYHSESPDFMDQDDCVVVIPATDFLENTTSNDKIKSYVLKLQIREATSELDEDSEESESSDEESDNQNDDASLKPKRKKKNDDQEEGDEDDPAGISLKNLTSGPRKRKSRYTGGKEQKKGGPEGNTRSHDLKSEQNKSDTKQKNGSYRRIKPPVVKKNTASSGEIISEIELLLFNSDFECQADTGTYELLVNDKANDGLDYKRKAVWESFDGGKEVKVYGTFSAPTLKLALKWCQESNLGPLAGSEVDQDRAEDEELLLATSGRCTRTAILTAKQNMMNGDSNSHTVLTPADMVEYRKDNLRSKSNLLSMNGITNGTDNISSNNHVYYQFMYNNNTQQQTESRDDFYCPWCQLNCMTLYGLMKHLKLCHPRFLFGYSQQSKGTVIVVTVNECYDGSYAGNPHNIFCQPGMAFSRRGPVRRIPLTDVLVYKPQRKPLDSNCSLAELLDKEDVEVLEPTQLSTGHRRLYFHSLTSLPVRPCEFDIDSEEEATEPDWLYGHTKRMIDEFTDVNEGEKALMKLWNLHVMRNMCVSDVQMEDECKKFIDKTISIIEKHSLRRNLLLHFLCLVDFGVFKTSSVLTLMDYYDEVKEKYLKGGKDMESADMTSQDFPEPDLLPRIKKLQEIIEKNS